MYEFCRATTCSGGKILLLNQRHFETSGDGIEGNSGTGDTPPDYYYFVSDILKLLNAFFS